MGLSAIELRLLVQQWRFMGTQILHINFIGSQSAKMSFKERLVEHSRGIVSFSAVADRLLQIIAVCDLFCIVKLCRQDFRLATRVRGIRWLMLGGCGRKWIKTLIWSFEILSIHFRSLLELTSTINSGYLKNGSRALKNSIVMRNDDFLWHSGAVEKFA